MLPDWIDPYQRIPDLDHSDRHGQEVLGQVIHATAAGRTQSLCSWAATSPLGRSWHLAISRGGSVYQQVALSRSAWHAGRSRWKALDLRGAQVNAATIGIELGNHLMLENLGTGYFYELGGRFYRYKGPDPVFASLTYPGGHKVEGWWEPYPEVQIDALERYLNELGEAGYPLRLIGHEEIATPEGRKLDPGPLFPWQRFAGMRGPQPDPLTQAELEI